MAPGYETSYPNDARHYVFIETVQKRVMYQVRIAFVDIINIDPPVNCSDEETKNQLKIWIAFVLAKKESKKESKDGGV